MSALLIRIRPNDWSEVWGVERVLAQRAAEIQLKRLTECARAHWPQADIVGETVTVHPSSKTRIVEVDYDSGQGPGWCHRSEYELETAERIREVIAYWAEAHWEDDLAEALAEQGVPS